MIRNRIWTILVGLFTTVLRVSALRNTPELTRIDIFMSIIDILCESVQSFLGFLYAEWVSEPIQDVLLRFKLGIPV